MLLVNTVPLRTVRMSLTIPIYQCVIKQRSSVQTNIITVSINCDKHGKAVVDIRAYSKISHNSSKCFTYHDWRLFYHAAKLEKGIKFTNVGI
jgi:hypothetical protein